LPADPLFEFDGILLASFRVYRHKFVAPADGYHQLRMEQKVRLNKVLGLNCHTQLLTLACIMDLGRAEVVSCLLDLLHP